ncbi:hypothetical protein [Cerasicoccus arenae]|uniref:Uncharacterized protein n=1 Tax=Cerasicoccus arenae TaxID=424488 RepID=A0A8J3DAF9_9BACT|nr:hypothetical protein [Cerasicoccus arenae]MBK1860003.1 hypothetical protein [Cerasicoccus arenae]GHB97023.1 hypothetical protein GCM10007047_11250 [Cerasicoccus arenae]
MIAKILGISIVAILFIALVWIGLSIKAKETVTVLRFKSGETFAVIRDSWIDDKACDHFLNALKQRIANHD